MLSFKFMDDFWFFGTVLRHSLKYIYLHRSNKNIRCKPRGIWIRNTAFFLANLQNLGFAY